MPSDERPESSQAERGRSKRQPRTIVLGDDSSPAADLGWLWINSHPWPQWRLEIVTAVAPEFGPPLPPERSELHAWEPVNPRLPFAEAGFAEVAHLTAEQDPRLALSRPTDLLVIGPRGPGLAKSLHLGSTAEWLAMHPPAPLVIARRGHRVLRVVLGQDGSVHANLVTDVLCRLPWIDQLAITVLGVDDGRADVKTATDIAGAQLEASGAAVEILIDTGKPTATLLHHVERENPDLVAIGTRGLTGLRRLRLGSTAGAVSRSATCSILLACQDDDGEAAPGQTT